MKASIDFPGTKLAQEDPKCSHLWQIIRTLFERTKKTVQNVYPQYTKTFDKISSANIVFPGAQPKSLCMEHIELLCQEEHLCCEKTDGVRYLFLQTSDKKRYLMERKGAFFIANDIEFLNIAKIPGQNTGTVLDQLDLMADGELVYDTINGQKVLNYLIYDVLWLNGKNFMASNLVQRLSSICPYVMALRCNNLDSMDSNKIHIYVKDMFKTTNIDFVLYKVIPSLPHKNDGIIFTKIDCPYYPGTCNEILKWKPPEKNTVDCQLSRGDHSKDISSLCYELMCTGSDNTREFFDILLFKNEDDEKKIRSEIIKLKENKGATGMAECYYDYEYYTEDLGIYKLILNEFGEEDEYNQKRLVRQIPKDIIMKKRAEIKQMEQSQIENLKGGWKIMQIRADKDKPNFIKVANNVKKSISDKITTEILITRLKSANPINNALTENPEILEENKDEMENNDEIDPGESENEEEDGISFDFISRKRPKPEESNPPEDQKKKRFEPSFELPNQ